MECDARSENNLIMRMMQMIVVVMRLLLAQNLHMRATHRTCSR